MRKTQYLSLIALLNEAEDVSLDGCRRDYTPGNVNVCQAGVRKMTFQTATLARKGKGLAGEMRGSTVTMTITGARASEFSPKKSYRRFLRRHKTTRKVGHHVRRGVKHSAQWVDRHL